MKRGKAACEPHFSKFPSLSLDKAATDSDRRRRDAANQSEEPPGGREQSQRHLAGRQVLPSSRWRQKSMFVAIEKLNGGSHWKC